MASKTKTDIKHEAKEAEDRLAEKLEIQAEAGLDKVRLADVSTRLRIECTSEAADRIREAFHRAEAEIDSEAERRAAELKKVSRELSTEEKELEKRSEDSARDALASARLASKLTIDSARSEIDTAANEALQDAEFLSEVKQSRENHRKKIESKSKEFRKKTHQWKTSLQSEGGGSSSKKGGDFWSKKLDDGSKLEGLRGGSAHVHEYQEGLGIGHVKVEKSGEKIPFNRFSDEVKSMMDKKDDEV